MMKDYKNMTQEECNNDEESELSIAAEFIMEHLPDNLKAKVTKEDVVKILELETDYCELRDIDSEGACGC